MTLQALIFDLGNVLVYFDHEIMVRQIAALSDLSPRAVRDVLLAPETMRRIERGDLSSHALHRLLCDASNKEIDFDTLMHAGASIFTPNTPLINCLPTFKKNNLRLVLLSNTCDMHINYIKKHYSLLNFFDALVLSHEAKCCKPEPEIYLKAIIQAGCPKENCLFVDDVLENVEGARAVGLPAYHFVGTEPLLAHLKTRGIA